MSHIYTLENGQDYRVLHTDEIEAEFGDYDSNIAILTPCDIIECNRDCYNCPIEYWASKPNLERADVHHRLSKMSKEQISKEI